MPKPKPLGGLETVAVANNIYVVETLAIYENAGTAASVARLTQRDADFVEAQQQADAVGRAVAPQSNEYMESFGGATETTVEPSQALRYGTGWRCRVWISVKSDADNIGNAIWTRLNGRNPKLKDGTIVVIGSRDLDQPGYVTGPILYRRRLPFSGDDIG